MESIVYEILNGELPITISIIGNGLFFYYEVNEYGEYSFSDIPCGDYIMVIKDRLNNIKFEHITLPTII